MTILVAHVYGLAYSPFDNAGSKGCTMQLFFTPNDLVDARKIGLTQSVASKKNGNPLYLRPEIAKRSLSKKEGDEGRHHDRAGGKTNPIYGMNDPADPKKDTYYGSVEWGYRVDAAGAILLLPFRVVKMGAPTREFMVSTKKWNQAKVDKGGKKSKTQNLPVTGQQSLSGAEFAALSDADLKKRVDGLKKQNRYTQIKGPNYKQRAFEIRALEREARTRRNNAGLAQAVAELIEILEAL